MHITQLQAILRQSPYSPLHTLAVSIDGDKVVLSGKVNTYYHKQLAQHAIFRIISDRTIVNNIEVRKANGLSADLKTTSGSIKSKL